MSEQEMDSTNGGTHCRLKQIVLVVSVIIIPLILWLFISGRLFFRRTNEHFLHLPGNSYALFMKGQTDLEGC